MGLCMCTHTWLLQVVYLRVYIYTYINIILRQILSANTDADVSMGTCANAHIGNLTLLLFLFLFLLHVQMQILIERKGGEGNAGE